MARKPKYNEPTKLIQHKVPISHHANLKKLTTGAILTYFSGLKNKKDDNP
jgi:hypothetical protein